MSNFIRQQVINNIDGQILSLWLTYIYLRFFAEHELKWTDRNWPEQVDPVTRRVHWSHASASWSFIVLIACSLSRNVSDRLVLNICIFHSGCSLWSSRTKKVKVAHSWLPSVWFRSWSRFLAVSLQVTWVTIPAVGCHYFPPGLQLPPQPWRGLLLISLLGEQRHDVCEQFA